MRILFKTREKRPPMSTSILLLILALAPLSVFSQPTKTNSSAAINTDSASYFLQKGLEEKTKGRRLESLKNFEKAAHYDPGQKAIITELASAYVDLRRYSQAIDSYKKLIEMGDVSADTYRQLMTLSFNFRKYDDVVLYASQLKKADPSAKTSYYVGKAYYDQENYGEAIKYLNVAAKEDPANAEVPYMIARAYADMMNYKLSTPFFEKAISLDSTKNRWVYELGLIYYAMHEDKKALQYILEAANRGYKRDNEYLENLGIAYLNVGDFDQGISIMGELLKRRPSDVNILNMMAEAYYNKGKYDQAIEYWDQILSNDKTNASSLYMIGMCYQKKGDKEKGIKLCDKAIEMDPSLSSLKQKKQMNF